MTKSKGRIRDKVKQVLLIEGTPSCLYTETKRVYTSVEVSGEIYKLGAVTDNFVRELEKIPSFKVVKIEAIRRHPVSIKLKGVGHRTIIRTVNNNTHIQVGAPDEVQLAQRVEMLKTYLDINGVNVTERCHWVCSFDKKEDNKTGEIVTVNVPIVETKEQETDRKEMSEKTKSLRDIAINAKKKNEMTIKMGLAAVYD